MEEKKKEEILLRPLKFSLRLGKVVLAAFNAWVLFDHYNFKERLVRGRIDNFYLEVQANFPEIYKTWSDESYKEKLEQFEEKTRLEVDEYLPMLFNQAL